MVFPGDSGRYLGDGETMTPLLKTPLFALALAITAMPLLAYDASAKSNFMEACSAR